MTSLFDVFLTPEALRINRARLDHLATLGLDLDRKTVLEVGAGIGLHTEFFERQGCDILSTEGSPANVAEMLRRYPHRQLGVLDLDRPGDLRGLGMFDIVYCYGTLYHLKDPDGALARLAAVCAGQILLETIVLPGASPEVQLVTEPLVANQGLFGLGCRPTRPWVMAALRRHFGHAYTTLDQPDYPDFITDWSVINRDGNLRAVFVGSKTPLVAAGLAETLPVRHRNASPRAGRRRPGRVFVDVGAHLGEHSLAAAAMDPALTVHAFEPLPSLHDALVRAAPPNFTVHALAVAEHDGVARFNVNGFDAASSLLSIDETARERWIDGHLLRDSREIVVPTTRLDTFLRENEIPAIEFLKIDAQGADLAVVRSLGDRIADVKRIQLEVVPGDRQLYRGAADKATILAHMAACGFALEETESQSYGQEENLTFARPSVSAEAAARNDAARPVPGLYALGRYTQVAGTARFEADRLEVTTAPEQWAYTAMIPPNRDGVETGSFVRITLSLEVDVGRLQAGILNEAETDFLTTAFSAAGPAQTVELVIPRFDRVGPLVVRNVSPSGVSHGWCKLLRIVAEPPADIETEDAPPFDEGGFQASRLRALAQDFAALPAEATGSRETIAHIEAMAETLRPMLVRAGLSLIRTGTAATDKALAAMDTAALLALADRLKILLPLEPGSDSHFGDFLRRPDFATLMRFALWHALNRRPDPPTIALPWHGGTTFLSRFDNDLSMAMFVGGAYEPSEFALLDRVLRPGMTVLDGGANEGAYTLFLASRVGPAGRVFAVEPSPRELARLHANLAANGLENVTVSASALAEHAGPLSLVLAEQAHAGQNTLGAFVYDLVVSAGTAQVPGTTIDELAASSGSAAIDIVKLDLEGAELRALAGAERTLATARPLVLFEASPAALATQGASVEALSALLDRAQYRILRFDGRTGAPMPLAGGPISDSLVAIHRERDFGLAAG